MISNEIKELFINSKVREVLFNEPMKNHTSYKIGGPADILIIPSNIDGLINSVKICRENKIDFYIIGNGSNLLVRDKGMRNVVIKINEGINQIKIDGNIIYCEAGISLTAVSRAAMKESLTGFEFANGIPGSIGGAVTMNAGAYGEEMKNVIKSVTVLNSKNEVIKYSKEEMNFRYRGSRVIDEGLIVLSIELELNTGNYEEIKSRIKELTRQRTSKQPLDLPSGGSIFKRPEGYYAGKLIEDSGLKGLRLGGAQISEKHCGFIVNLGDATCNNVLQLISVVQKVVRDTYDINLEVEIRIIGED